MNRREAMFGSDFKGIPLKYRDVTQYGKKPNTGSNYKSSTPTPKKGPASGGPMNPKK